MNIRRLFIGLFGLFWLLAVGCVPITTDNPAAATQPVALTTPTPTPAPITTPTPEATPFPTPISAAEAQQTQEAQQVSQPLPPSETPTITATPTPTFTPIPGLVWQIQFRGAPCPNMSQSSGDCSKYASALDSIPDEDYIIDSNGSRFATLSEAGIFLANYDNFYLLPNSFSLDGSHIAFATGDCIYVSDLVGSDPICLIPEGFPAGYRFSPDGGCLTAYFRVPESESPSAQVRVQRNCLGEDNIENIGTFEFADLPARPMNYELSPEGDALLAWGRMPEGELRLYVQEIGAPTPPLLLYTYPNEDLETNFVAVRWLPDGSAVEFLLDTRPENTFFRINRDGSDLTPGVSLPEQFQVQLGDWSPDGEEFAFSHVEEDRTKTGLYIVDLQTGNWRQFLSGYHVSSARVRTWSVDAP